jgi:hypothetical protein
MGRWDKIFEANKATIQAEVPELCLAVGGLQPAGTLGSFGLTKLSPAAGTFQQHKANQAAGDLTGRHGLETNRITYLAVTADKVYAFDAKPKRKGNIEVVSKLAEWNRSDVKVQTIRGKLSTRVVIDHADGGHYELESMAITNFNEPLFAALEGTSET